MQAQYEFEETQSHVRYTVPLKGTSSKNVDVYYSPVHMKINFAPYFLLIDFPERVENEKHGVSSGSLVVELKKEVNKLWGKGTMPIMTKKSNVMSGQSYAFSSLLVLDVAMADLDLEAS